MKSDTILIKNGKGGQYKESAIRAIQTNPYGFEIELKSGTKILLCDGPVLHRIKQQIELIENAKKGRAA